MDYVQIVAPALFSNALLLIGWKVFKKRIYGQTAAFANQFIAELMEDAIKNPEKLAPLLDALTKQGMKSLGVTKEAAIPGMKIGGFKIPGWLIQSAMPLIQGQMKKGGLGAAEEVAKSVFG